MQVSEVNQHVTHAVIGGNKAIAVTMDDSPEFYHILSSTLYSDQMLAMIRETLCNGWDAHIEAGITDKPLTVTTIGGYLIIRDYGHGIPHALVGDIYGKYGGSTKKNTKGVTGGFGLGCKSPWAYKDHFEMTDWCEGQMTVYNCSKSNAEVNGKPSILPIVSVPTTENGLQVKVQIKPGDEQRIRQLIKRIANNGNIKVVLDGETNPLPTLPFDKIKHKFLITSEQLNENKQEKILLRYGNVIYPVGIQPKFHNEYMKIKNILDNIPSINANYYSEKLWKIVFQAEPDTISVTPSRETLSMQGHTITTIKNLMDEFLKNYKEELAKEFFKIMKSEVDNIYLKGVPGILLNKDLHSVRNHKHNKIIATVITDFKELATFSYSHNYPSINGFREKDIRYRVQSLSNAGYIDRGLAKSFLRAMDKNWKQGAVNNWFQKRIIWPLYRDLTADPLLSVEKLWLYGKDHSNHLDKGNKSRYRYNDINSIFIPVKSFMVKSHISYMPFLKKVVTLAYARPSVSVRAPYFPKVKHWLGGIEDSLVYIVARHPDKVAAAKAFFEARGFSIIDLTVAQPWEEKEVVEPQVTYTPKPKKIGVARLDNILNPSGGISTNRAKEKDAILITDPEFVVVFAKKNDDISLEQISNTSTKTICDLWGDKGGIVVNVNQLNKYTDQGAKPMYQYICEKLTEAFTTNPRIVESLPFDWTRWKPQDSYTWNRLRNFLRVIYADKDLRDYFGIIWTLTPEDQKLIDLWKDINSKVYPHNVYMDTLAKKVNTIKLDPIVETVGELIENSKYLKILEEDYILDFINNNRLDPKKRNQIRDFFLEMLEG